MQESSASGLGAASGLSEKRNNGFATMCGSCSRLVRSTWGSSTREIERNKCDNGCFRMATWRSTLKQCEHG